MARKKRTVQDSTAGSDVPQLPTLTREEILNLRLLDAEARLAARDGAVTRLEKEAYLARIDPQNRLIIMDNHMTVCRSREEAARAAYTELLDKTGKRLGIDLNSGCTIDPESGAIIQHQKKE